VDDRERRRGRAAERVAKIDGALYQPVFEHLAEVVVGEPAEIADWDAETPERHRCVERPAAGEGT
jgi:hypothetical protein